MQNERMERTEARVAALENVHLMLFWFERLALFLVALLWREGNTFCWFPAAYAFVISNSGYIIICALDDRNLRREQQVPFDGWRVTEELMFLIERLASFIIMVVWVPGSKSCPHMVFGIFVFSNLMYLICFIGNSEPIQKKQEATNGNIGSYSDQELEKEEQKAKTDDSFKEERVECDQEELETAKDKGDEELHKTEENSNGSGSGNNDELEIEKVEHEDDHKKERAKIEDDLKEEKDICNQLEEVLEKADNKWDEESQQTNKNSIASGSCDVEEMKVEKVEHQDDQNKEKATANGEMEKAEDKKDEEEWEKEKAKYDDEKATRDQEGEELQILRAELCIKYDELNRSMKALCDKDCEKASAKYERDYKIKLKKEKDKWEKKLKKKKDKYEENRGKWEEERNNLAAKLSAVAASTQVYKCLLHDKEEHRRKLEEEKNDLAAKLFAATASNEVYKYLLRDYDGYRLL